MQAELHGVIPLTNGSFEPLQQSAIRWSSAVMSWKCEIDDYHYCVQAELHGLIPVTNGSFEPLQQSAIRWSNAVMSQKARKR